MTPEQEALRRRANEYARDARKSTTGGQYSGQWKSQLARWWLAGYRGELRQASDNRSRPLYDAWLDGQRTREAIS